MSVDDNLTVNQRAEDLIELQDMYQPAPLTIQDQPPHRDSNESTDQFNDSSRRSFRDWCCDGICSIFRCCLIRIIAFYRYFILKCVLPFRRPNGNVWPIDFICSCVFIISIALIYLGIILWRSNTFDCPSNATKFTVIPIIIPDNESITEISGDYSMNISSSPLPFIFPEINDD